MVAKKSENANLESKKSFFILIGFVLVLSLLFISLEWSQGVKKYVGIDLERQFTEEIEIQNTIEKVIPPPLPPLPLAFEKIEIVPNNELTKDVKFTSEGTDDPIPFANPVQFREPEAEPDVPMVIVEEPPTFHGNVFKFLSDNVNYPSIAVDNSIQGKVICQFVVNKDGSIVDIEVVRGVHPSLDNEAVRVIKSMPKWSPGKQRGKAVRVKFTLPVNFKLVM